MSDSERTFIIEFKKQVIAIAVLYAFALVIVAVGFYYTTNNSITNAEKERKELKQETLIIKMQVDILKDSKINKEDYIREITEMKDLLRDLNNKLDRLK